MGEFIFTLIFCLPDRQVEPEEWVEALGAGGCDDAIIGIGTTGRIALNFTRVSANAEEAVVTALQDVMRVIPGAVLVEAAPDLVGLTDIAELLGFSRQYMRKVMVTRTAFPAPVHDGKTALWHLESVLRWMQGAGVTPVPSPLLDVAVVTRQCNLRRALMAVNPVFQQRLGDI